MGAESLAMGSEHTAVGDGTSCVDLMKGELMRGTRSEIEWDS